MFGGSRLGSHTRSSDWQTWNRRIDKNDKWMGPIQEKEKITNRCIWHGENRRSKWNEITKLLDVNLQVRKTEIGIKTTELTQWLIIYRICTDKWWNEENGITETESQNWLPDRKERNNRQKVAGIEEKIQCDDRIDKNGMQKSTLSTTLKIRYLFNKMLWLKFHKDFLLNMLYLFWSWSTVAKFGQTSSLVDSW